MGALLVAEAGGGPHRRRPCRLLAARDPRARSLRDDPGSLGAPGLAQPRIGHDLVERSSRSPASEGAKRLEVGLPRETSRDRGDRGLLPRQRLRASGPAHAEEAVSAELLMVEQREGEGDAAHWILEGGRILPGVDDNRRMAELRRGLLRHAGVRSAGADADSEEVEQTLSVAARPRLPRRPGGGLRGAGGDPDLTPPGLHRHPGLRRPRGSGPRGGEDGDHRGRAARRRRPLHLCALPSAGSSCWARLVCRLLLPEHRGGGGAGPARPRRQPGWHPRRRPALPKRHGGDRRVDARCQPALAARLAGHQRRRVDGTPSSEREHVVEFEGSPDAETTSTPSPSDRDAGRPRASSSRSATTSSPATRTAPGISRRRSSPRSAVCLPLRACPSA